MTDMCVAEVDLVGDEQAEAGGATVDLGLLRRLGGIAQARIDELDGGDQDPSEVLSAAEVAALDVGPIVTLLSAGLPESMAAELAATVGDLPAGEVPVRLVRARLKTLLGWGMGLLASVEESDAGRRVGGPVRVPAQLASLVAAAAAGRPSKAGDQPGPGQYL